MQPFTVWLSTHSNTILGILPLLLALPLLHLGGRLIQNGMRKKLSEQARMLLSRGLVYIGSFIIVLMILQQLGIKIGTLLGAAGIAGVAIGFAAQTSLSNLISGLFLIWEAPFKVGDLISAGSDTGVVFSIDLLSVQLRTFSNQLIRIPNESLIKNSFTNITRFPIRRMDIPIGVAYKEDIPKVVRILQDIAEANPHCLDEPAPVIIFQGFGQSALEFLFGPWFAKADFVQLRNSLLPEIKRRFDEEGIEIPFPHRTLYMGSDSRPFDVRIVGDAPDLEKTRKEPE